MIEKQNQQNIPAPVPSENNQNITPVNRWQIKSWQIVLFGIIINWILLIGIDSLAYSDFNNELFNCIFYNCHNPIDGAYAGSMIFFVSIILSIIEFVLLILLCFDKTRKNSAIFCVLIGLLFGFLLMTIPLGIFSFIAGIYYFRKKV